MKDARSEVFGIALGAAITLVVLIAGGVFLPIARCSEYELHFFVVGTNVVVPGAPVSDAVAVPCPRCGDRGRFSLYDRWRVRAYERSTLVY